MEGLTCNAFFCDGRLEEIWVHCSRRELEKGENSVTICAENKSSEQRFRRSGTRTHARTCTMLSDTNRDEHWDTAFNIITCHSICRSLRWICAHKQYLLETPYVSPLCMFGESVFALIPDHEVRAAKLRNRWISGCWAGRDASSDEHPVGTKFGVLKCSSVRRKPPGEQWSRRQKNRGSRYELEF